MRRWLAVVVAAVLITGCATAPPAPTVRPSTEEAPALPSPPPSPEPTPSPPSLAVPAPRIAPQQPAQPPVDTPAPAPPLRGPPPETEPPIVLPPLTTPEPTDEQQLAALLADLQRYGNLQGEDVRRELAVVTQTSTRARNDYYRVRLAVLYTLAKTTPQDDQRALQLLEAVAKSNPGTPTVKQLAAVLQAQIAERARAVRDEQQKADAAIKKLEALRSMERDLLRDRMRGGGGGAGGGSSGGGGGGGGGGG